MKKITALSFMILITGYSSLFSWFDKTHIAIGKLAGFREDYSLTAPDILKIKYLNEGPNHYYNCRENEEITRQLVIKQTKDYNVLTNQGNLYGAIVASIRNAKAAKDSGKHIATYLSFTGHYIGDLSNPVHNMRFNDFNIARHTDNDAVLDGNIQAEIKKIRINAFTIKNEEELIDKIIEIAAISKRLGYKLQRDYYQDNSKGIMTKEEALNQIKLSADLFKSVLDYIGY